MTEMVTAMITLTDLRASERRIARAVKLVAKRENAWEKALQALEAEKQRHDALVELYQQQTTAR